MRLDKSRLNQLTSLRPIKARQSLLNRTDGSSRFSFGDSTCLTGIYEHSDQSTTYHTLTKESDPSRQNLLNDIIKNLIMEDTKVQAICQVIHDDGSTLSIAINSLIFALIDAGIPMKNHGGAVCCAITKENIIILDPNLEEEKNSKSVHTFVFDSNGKMILCNSIGSFTSQEVSCFF